jgi:hypothetical protein
MKKRAKKMADGGMPEAVPPKQDKPMPPPLVSPGNPVVASIRKNFGFAKGGFVEDEEKSGYEDHKYADGGQIKDNYQTAGNPHMKDGLEEPEHEMASGFVDHEGDVKRPDRMAIEEDDRRLNEHGQEEEGEQGGGQGFHGEDYMGNPGNSWDNYQSDAHMEDMVGRIMKQRQMHYSEGGKVANSGEGKLDEMADGKPNNFDDLSMRDDLEFSYTGANSGDEDGNEGEDARRADIISRIMASRRKKDRMPNPA